MRWVGDGKGPRPGPQPSGLLGGSRGRKWDIGGLGNATLSQPEPRALPRELTAHFLLTQRGHQQIAQASAQPFSEQSIYGCSPSSPSLVSV